MRQHLNKTSDQFEHIVNSVIRAMQKYEIMNIKRNPSASQINSSSSTNKYSYQIQQQLQEHKFNDSIFRCKIDMSQSQMSIEVETTNNTSSFPLAGLVCIPNSYHIHNHQLTHNDPDNEDSEIKFVADFI
ncbi:Hypothetical_protein [Hexamita inflata]|uniref:Hypothetical_protein n=1 Tax=Hexamita inflata TaxID=28002 RepID=A0AA86RUH4_9EUKA|nr:Hypothetical protein HINF_LOCUS65754 [Hexamita inflata]